MSVSVRVSVYLSAQMSQETTCPNFKKFLYMLRVVVACSLPDDNAKYYVLPVLWMTSCLLHNGPYGAWLIGRTLKVTHQGAELDAKSCCFTHALFRLLNRTFK